MFSAFFGHYLLNKGVVTAQQLQDILVKQGEVRLKLGTLAINDGFMTAEQVEEIHQLQASMDKRFGELAMEKAYLNEAQLGFLLRQQKAEHLLLAQALIDEQIMTMDEFESELKTYKEMYDLSDDQFEALQGGNVEIAINSFLAFEGDDKNKYHEYLSLFLKNMIRFIDPNVSVDRVQKVKSISLEHVFKQRMIDGSVTIKTVIAGEKDVILNLASRYADEDFTELGDYPVDAVGEFLNLHNGLFVVNRSNQGVEMELTVQGYSDSSTIRSDFNMYHVPVYTSFGTLDLVIGRV